MGVDRGIIVYDLVKMGDPVSIVSNLTNKSITSMSFDNDDNVNTITSNDIFSEIGRLSVYGLIPVLGGIAGGIAGDMLTDPDYKAKIPNKIKEGAYQYLANIFLCNIGAGAALGILENVT